MDDDIKLLNFVYQNSKMGVDTISQLIDIVEGNKFKLYLKKKQHGYKRFNLKARRLLNKHGFSEKDLTTYEKVRTYLMISAQTLTDHSTSHIAKMMIVGTTMGIINAIRNINKYHRAKKEIIKLIKDLKRFEEKSFNDLKIFL